MSNKYTSYERVRIIPPISSPDSPAYMDGIVSGFSRLDINSDEWTYHVFVPERSAIIDVKESNLIALGEQINPETYRKLRKQMQIAQQEIGGTSEQVRGSNLNSFEDQQATPDESTAQQTKKCPYCAEEIKFEAIVCRYCSRDLRGNNAPPTISIYSTPRTSSTLPYPVQPERSNVAIYVVGALILAVGLFYLITILGTPNYKQKILGEWTCSGDNGRVGIEFFPDGVFVSNANRFFPRGQYVWTSWNQIRFDEPSLVGVQSNTAVVRFEGDDTMYINALKCSQ